MVDNWSDHPYGHVRLALFVDGGLLSTFVLKQIEEMKKQFGITDEQITTYDVKQDIEHVVAFNIIACPTLVRLDANPPRYLIGELRNQNMVRAFLNIEVGKRS